ncbi:MAG: YpmA family protein [Bacillota bacterium]|nr:YpmA family protein [Bacillota bacterium]
MDENKGKLELLAWKSFSPNDDLVRVVDFLNKTLKEKDLMFGIAKDKEKNGMVITVYEV